jgi:hypothetical protein
VVLYTLTCTQPGNSWAIGNSAMHSTREYNRFIMFEIAPPYLMICYQMRGIAQAKNHEFDLRAAT